MPVIANTWSNLSEVAQARRGVVHQQGFYGLSRCAVKPSEPIPVPTGRVLYEDFSDYPVEWGGLFTEEKMGEVEMLKNE